MTSNFAEQFGSLIDVLPDECIHRIDNVNNLYLPDSIEINSL